MGEVSNNQSFHSDSNSTLLSSLATKWKIAQDTVLQGGRDIIIHLPPGKSSCPGGCRFNSSYKKFISSNGSVCRTCTGEGFLFEQRWTTYRANIRQVDVPLESDEALGQDTPAGRLSQRLVRTRTVIQSYNHLMKSIGATIDGEKYKMWNDPKKTGFGGNLYYVVTFWKKIDK